MADKKDSKSSGHEMGLGLIFVLIIIGIFIIWILTGGPSGSKEVIKTKTTEKTVWPATNDIPTFGPTNNTN